MFQSFTSLRAISSAAALGVTLFCTSSAATAGKLSTCSLMGISLKGKVQVVTSFPDLKVQKVSSFPDLRVQQVTSFPDACGKWHFVESFPDFTIQYVDSFPDLKVEFVESFPGVE